jgi:ribose 5-phosphate isomerase A
MSSFTNSVIDESLEKTLGVATMSTSDLKSKLAAYIAHEHTFPAVVGFGGGSTVSELMKQLPASTTSVVTASYELQQQALEQELMIVTDIPVVPVVYDGADLVIPDQKVLIKGRGGALLREKILLTHTQRPVILVDETKWSVPKTINVPVEISPYLHELTCGRLKEYSIDQEIRVYNQNLREVYYTENNNMIVDIEVESRQDLRSLYMSLIALPGVLEVGIFFKLTCELYTVYADGGVETTKW